MADTTTALALGISLFQVWAAPFALALSLSLSTPLFTAPHPLLFQGYDYLAKSQPLGWTQRGVYSMEHPGEIFVKVVDGSGTTRVLSTRVAVNAQARNLVGIALDESGALTLNLLQPPILWIKLPAARRKSTTGFQFFELAHLHTRHARVISPQSPVLRVL